MYRASIQLLTCRFHHMFKDSFCWQVNYFAFVLGEHLTDCSPCFADRGQQLRGLLHRTCMAAVPWYVGDVLCHSSTCVALQVRWRQRPDVDIIITVVSWGAFVAAWFVRGTDVWRFICGIAIDPPGLVPTGSSSAIKTDGSV